MTGNCTFTFASPTQRHLQLRMIEGSGGFSRTWPATVKWFGAEPTWATGAGKVNIANFYYDGTNYWGNGSVNGN